MCAHSLVVAGLWRGVFVMRVTAAHLDFRCSGHITISKKVGSDYFINVMLSQKWLIAHTVSNTTDILIILMCFTYFYIRQDYNFTPYRCRGKPLCLWSTITLSILERYFNYKSKWTLVCDSGRPARTFYLLSEYPHLLLLKGAQFRHRICQRYVCALCF